MSGAILRPNRQTRGGPCQRPTAEHPELCVLPIDGTRRQPHRCACHRVRVAIYCGRISAVCSGWRTAGGRASIQSIWSRALMRALVSRVFHCDTTRSSLTTMFIVLSLGPFVTPFAQCVVNLDIGYLSMPSPEIPRRNLFYGPFYCFFFLFLFNRCETQKV